VQPIDWQRLLVLATEHHVLPQLSKALSAVAEGEGGAAGIRAMLPGGGVPPDVVVPLQRDFAVNAGRNVRKAAILQGLQQLMRAQGIDLVPIKGPALAVLAYGDLALRQFDDLDLLVRPADLLRTVDALEHAGYQVRGLPRSADRARYVSSLQDWSLHGDAGQVNLDLKPVLVSHTMSTSKSTEYLRESCHPLEVGNGQCLAAPGPEAMLLAVCVDAACDLWGRLSAAADVAALLARHPAGGWNKLLDDATRLGQRRSVLVGAAVADELLGASLPIEIREAAYRDATARRLAAQAVARLRGGAPVQGSTARKCLFALRTREGARDRARYAARLLFVANSPDLNLMALPSPLYFLYSAVRPIRLGWAVVRRGKKGPSRARAQL
jgi:hypothetical protein